MTTTTTPTTADTSARAAGGAVATKTAATGVLVTEHGKTTIAESVVEKIAGMAAREVPGVHKLGGGTARAIGALRDRIPGQQASLSQGVGVEVGERQAAVDLIVVVDYGLSIARIADEIRSNVTDSLEQMTGLEVTEVNIAVQDIHLPDEDDDDTADAPADTRVQ